MSSIRSPQDKKRLSLERDRRNTYGENSKSSRKSIRSGKQRSHMKLRRGVHETLDRLKGDVQELDATEIELLAKIQIVKSQRGAFKKYPDTPLGVVIRRKLAKRGRG
jgi:hypothetical protein